MEKGKLFTKKILALVFIAIFCVVALSSPLLTYAEKTDSSSESTETTESTTTEVAEPTVTAKGAILYCMNTGETLYQKNATTKLSPYSITKLLTALMVVQKLPMDQKVTVSKTAASISGSTMNLKEGEEVTVEQLLYGLLIESGNDAAYALAEAYSDGDVTAFVDEMNKMASNLGCKNTHFANPNGLADSNHYTTCADFLKIAKAALANETIAKIAGTKKYEMEATNKSDARTMTSHLDLINDEDSGIVCGKTGYNTDSDCSIVVEYNKDGLQLLVILIGDTKSARPTDITALTNYGKQKVEGVKVIKAGVQVGKIMVRKGEKTRLAAYTETDGYAYLPSDASEDVIKTEVVLNSGVKAPLKAGDVVGTYNIYAGTTLVNSINIVVKENVKKGWFPSYIWISNRMSIVIAAIIVVIIVFIISGKARKRKKIRQKEAARRRRIMEIAQQQLREEEEKRKRGWRF